MLQHGDDRFEADERVEAAVERLSRGEFIVVVDDKDRENEGDLILAAEHATADALAFMVRHTSGIVCVSLEAHRLLELGIRPMVGNNSDPNGTAFMESVDYAPAVSTGISAHDRAATIRALVDSTTRADHLTRPGHVFPLECREGGVLKRAGHTEAAVDLSRFAGLTPAGVLAEIVNDDGTVARLPQLRQFARKNGLMVISVAEIVQYRRRRERLIRREAAGTIVTRFGQFQAVAFRSCIDDIEHLVLVKGDVSAERPILVRVHSECLTGDAFGSKRCDCGAQLALALERICREGLGVLVYLRGHEGRGVGLIHKLRAYTLQDERGLDTVDANLELGFPADSREYGIGAQMLVDLGVKQIRLLTNNPAKYRGLAGYGLKIVERVPLRSVPSLANFQYLLTKQQRLDHCLGIAPHDRPGSPATAVGTRPAPETKLAFNSE